MRSRIIRSMVLVISIVGLGACLVSAAEPWPAPVPGFKPLTSGEHPRLLFRKPDLPALRQRAKTEEGHAILKRLRITLNGNDAESMPANLGVKGKVNKDGSGEFAKDPAGKTFTISHVAGYGFLYQITGDKKYADLGRKAMDIALEGYRGRDRRYSFKHPYGALRAGPSLGWGVLGYDLCYDGWDEAYRKRIAGIICDYNEGQHMSLEELVKGKRHFPASNHWGMQVGGGAMALMAITGDEGIDQARIDGLLKDSEKSMIRNVTEGFGDGGYFAEGDGTGSMASHIIYLSAIQAWKVAMGKDFVSPRPNVRWTALKWFLLTIPQGDDMRYLRKGFPERGGYPHNIWARPDGVSGAGYFSMGYEAVLPEERQGIWWFYHNYVKDWDDKNSTPWDTISPYPHHSILAFVNTPFGTEPIDPTECIPRNVRDTKYGFFGFRNRWKDEDDIVITQLARRTTARFRHGPDRNMIIRHHGKKESWGSIPSKVTDWRPGKDGSAVLGDGQTSVAIDFSGASGADGMLVMTGPGAPSDNVTKAGGHAFSLRFLTKGNTPTPKAQGNKVVIGKQTVSMQEGKLVLGVFAGQ
ncbi:MAG: hypothetical protein QGH15_04315 [Kiritimatiellia bacterium]|nr:hypothetical protein [Kiritimatiellia bacterium]